MDKDVIINDEMFEMILKIKQYNQIEHWYRNNIKIYSNKKEFGGVWDVLCPIPDDKKDIKNYGKIELWIPKVIKLNKTLYRLKRV